MIRFEGVTHLFWVDQARPEVIQRARSVDLLHWQPDTSLPARAAPIEMLSLFQRGPQVLFAVSTAEETSLLAGTDLTVWKQAAVLANERLAFPFTCSGSRTTRGQMLFSVSSSVFSQDEGLVRCRWGRTIGDAAQAAGAEAATAPESRRITGISVHPTFGEQCFALIIDAQTTDIQSDTQNEAGFSRPFYALSGDCASYTDPLRPLAFTAPTPPRMVQPYARARNYWLVTYLREIGGQARLFWATLDWEESVPVLREITGADAWEQAFQTIGLV